MNTPKLSTSNSKISYRPLLLIELQTMVPLSIVGKSLLEAIGPECFAPLIEVQPEAIGPDRCRLFGNIEAIGPEWSPLDIQPEAIGPDRRLLIGAIAFD
jgi:hypothetical protein